MNVPERIAKLRSLMKEHNMDAYVVPSADNHQSEYVGEYFKSMAFITGFSGEAGTAIITQDVAGLWTDGRFFLQADMELKDTGVTLFKMAEPGVPTTAEYLAQTLPEGGVLGFDGRVISMGEGNDWAQMLAAKNVTINYDFDLVGEVWGADRPALSEKKAFFLEEKYTGESTASKLSRIREVMDEKGCNAHIITSLDDTCWIMNVRGDDVAYSPLLLSYSIIYKDKVSLYVDEAKLNDEINANLKANNVTVYPYNDIYEAVKAFGEGDKLLIDPARMNYALYNNLSDKAEKVELLNPSYFFKAQKNEVELKNIRAAHIKDGVAHTRFIYWLKQNIGKMEITEMSAADKLEEFRAQQEGFMWPSFEPISAYGEHAAIVHYTSSPETNIPLEPKGLYLTDTGGNYKEGSTDITRTIALGELTQEEKEHFTMTCRSNMLLADAKFMYGACGFNLDILARKPFWDVDLNFNHGTGHGVGYLLNIHEGPTGFRWMVRPGEKYPLEKGMIITDEPGIYIAGSHGIRIENELEVVQGNTNEYGTFMSLKSVTFCPIDLDAILPEKMTEEERNLLNDYHKQVYDVISPYLEGAEKEWLKEATRAI